MPLPESRRNSRLRQWLMGAILLFSMALVPAAAPLNAATFGVTVSSPKPGDNVSKGETQLLAMTSDTSTGVYFMIKPADPKNGSPFSLNATQVTMNTWRVIWNSSGAPSGAYEVHAIAGNPSGGEAFSPTISFTLGTVEPTVTLTMPTNDATLSGDAGLSATVSATVNSLKFVITPTGGSSVEIDGVPGGSGTTYTATWDTTKVANGSYGVLAKIFYGDGSTAVSSSAPVNVNNAAPLTITPEYPTGGESLTGTVWVSAKTSAVAYSMQFLVKSGSTTVKTLNGSSSDGKTWTVSWDTTEVSNGSYTMDIKVTSPLGLKSAAVPEFTVVNAPPFTASISNPKAGDTVTGTMQVTASTSALAASAQFFVKKTADSVTVATLNGTSGNGTAWTATWDSKAVQNGSYKIEMKALTSGGTPAYASVTGLTVNNIPDPALSVGVTLPVANAILKGTTALSATTNVVATSLVFAISSADQTINVNATSGDGKIWTATWDTTGVEDGIFGIVANAAKASENAASASVPIQVKNVQAMAVAVTSPSPNVTLNNTITFIASATPAPTALSFAVRASNATQESIPLVTLSASPSSNTWSTTWDSKTVPNGAYKVTPVATKDGVQTAGTPVGFNVSNDNQQQQQQQQGDPVAVVMTSPEQSSSVQGKIAISATANQAVDSLQFTINGSPSGPLVLSATGNGTKTVWTAQWDTASAPNGDYVIVGTASKGGVATPSAGRSVKVANVSVSLGFTAPANNATVSGMAEVILAAIPEASTVLVRIAKLDNLSQVSERVAKYDAALQVWKLTWNTADFSNQKYRIDATATDNLGKKYSASPLTVTVSNLVKVSEAAFTATLVSPKDGGVIYGNVPLGVVVTGDAVTVKFYVTPDAGGNVATVDGRYDSGLKRWVATWSSVGAKNGTYKIGAVAMNSKNQKAESLTATSTLMNKEEPAAEPVRPPALSVSLVAPAGGLVGERTKFVAVTTGTPTAVTIYIARMGVAGTPTALPAHFEAAAQGWVAEWDSSKADIGTYVATASAKDATGTTESNAVTLYVERRTTQEPEPVAPPSDSTADLAIRIIRPTEAATVHGSIALVAKASASATSVTFSAADGSGAQSYVAAGKFSASLGAWVAYLDTTTLKDGRVQLSATANDAVGKRVVYAVGVSVANGSARGDVEKVDVLPTEAVREAVRTTPPGTKPLDRQRIEPPPVDVAEKLYKLCADAGIAISRCEAWLASQQERSECRTAGILTKEECVSYLKRLHGDVPGCVGKDKSACAEATVKETAGLFLSDDLERAARAAEKHVGTHIDVPPSNEDGEKPADDDVLAYVSIGRREGLKLDVHASPEFVRTDKDNSHRSVPAVLFIDTDGDGLPDDVEKRFGTKPGVADTDGDGFSDGDEVKNGYNPLGPGRLVDGVKLAPVDVAIVSGAPIEHPKSSGKETDELVVENVDPRGDEETVTLSGKARPREIVTLFIYSYLPVVLTTTADEEGNWSYELGATLDDGQHEVYVAVTDETGKITEKSSPLAFFVAGAQAASADEFYKSEEVATSPTAAAIAAEPVRQSAGMYVIATAVLVLIAGAFAFLLFRPKKPDGAPPA
jgi:hypothetical protein